MSTAPQRPVTSRRRTLRRVLAATAVLVTLAAGTATATVASAAGAAEPTTTAVTITPDYVYLGSPVTVSAAVSAAAGVPSGSVTFTVIGMDWEETQVPLVNGVATLVLDDLGLGPNRIAADYTGDDLFAPSKDWSWKNFVEVAEFLPPVADRVWPEV